MTDIELLNAGQAIGLDIGDGESALAWSSTDHVEEIRIYHRQSTGEISILTALARDPERDNKYIFGEETLFTDGAIQFTVNFKCEPTPGELETPDAVLFAQALLEEFFKAHPDERKECVVFIGYPVGWSTAAVKEYSRHFLHLGLPVYLLAESQSAMVHVRDRSSSESKLLDNVLVLDIGSSTTDITIVEDMIPTNLDIGVDLGCRQIDEDLAKMARRALRGDPLFTAALAREGGQKLLLLACRREKEEQFWREIKAKFPGRWEKEEQFPDQPPKLQDSCWAHTAGLDPIVDQGGGWLRGQEISHIIQRRGGWANKFEELIEKVKERLKRSPSFIILTGGGSRMPFVWDICMKAFPKAALDLDNEPSLSVARGLASAGLQRVRVARFRRDMDAIVTSPETDNLIREQTERAFEAIKESIVAAMRSQDQATWHTIVTQPPSQERIVDDLQRSISGHLVPRMQNICEAYGIDSSRFPINLTLPQLFATQLIQRIANEANFEIVTNPSRFGQSVYTLTTRGQTSSVASEHAILSQLRSALSRAEFCSAGKA